jgi:hypothetical protein
MAWTLTTEEYREFTITKQVCTVAELEEGDIITVEINGEEVDGFETVEDCKEYLDELADEAQHRAEREARYWRRTGHAPSPWFHD